MDSLVSILIPAYNAENWISDTIKSALGQTWTRKEIIVIDDGSTDQTLVVARQFASKHVQVSTQPNMGGGGTRNKLLSIAQGDHVQWLDADDLLSEDKIARQVRALEECGRRTLASSAWGYFMHRPNSAKFHPAPLWADLSPREWLLRKLEHNDFMQTATWLVSRELT